MERLSSPDLPELVFSSPPRRQETAKPKRPPTVTPKRFSRFFNPSSSSSVSSRSGRALRDLTATGVNRVNGLHSNVREDGKLHSSPPTKRRKFSGPDEENDLSDVVFSSSPPLPSPCQTSRRQRAEQLYPLPLVRSKLGRLAPSCPVLALDFFSSPADRHIFASPNLPFCTAACNTNSLVAVGGESGEIRILESSADSSPQFSQPYVTFAPHHNAIMDLAFSSDDTWLATASGDQSAKIIDMRTQTPLYVLAEHTSSLKQVAFQPNNDQVIATCSRDSVIALWDLRCTQASPVLRTPSTDEAEPDEAKAASKPRYARIYKSIVNGHADLVPATTSKHPRVSDAKVPASVSSVTALAFLPNSPHLFVTACDSSSRLRIWDIRSRMQAPRTRSSGTVAPPLPVSTSAPVPSHGSKRTYGITSLALSTDAARLYAVSRDSTVHVYSTPQLILGQAPTRPKAGLEGAAPLHALRDPHLRVGSFYIRATVRPATALHPELVAVGSSDASIVLFPTDRRGAATNGDGPGLRLKQRAEGAGTTLVGGHKSEVTGLAWTSNGELVSCADDYVARVWREDRARARDLRCGGEGQGRRWGCGWSEAEGQELWDEDEDEA